MKGEELPFYKKELGLLRVERAYNDWIVSARRFAVRHSAQFGSVSAVEVRAWAERTNNHPDKPTAYAAIFRGKEWQPIGERVQTLHADGHARRVECWKYVSSVYRREGTK